MNDTDKIVEREQHLELLRQKQDIMRDLPHLYGWNWYPWAKEFFDSVNKMNLLCAANQISKSSTQIRKAIHWATESDLWKSLWLRPPNLFWYFYPSAEVATIEFQKKWIPEFMPRGAKKDCFKYGWREEYDKKFIKAIHFNSGVSLYFKFYSQNVMNLQAGSVYAIFTDEELPMDYYSELKARLFGTSGYFNMVFTATLNQEFWWRALEGMGTSQEVLPNAWKRQVSMYDCLKYTDGSDTPWTIARIKEVEEDCKSPAEVQRRVHGRFIKEEGRIYHAFDPTKHYIKPFKIPGDWTRWVGADYGSGGPRSETDNHPSSLVYVAVRPDYKFGVVYRGWRGDDVYTTEGDIYDKHKELISPHENFIEKRYDPAAKDFGTITQRLGESWTKAENSHAIGEGIVNTLYKNDMLKIFDLDELRKLGVEMLGVQHTTPKNKRKDDYCDAQRYAVVEIPWDFTGMEGFKEDEPEQKLAKMPKTPEEYAEWEIEQRRGQFADPRKDKKDGWDESINTEIEAMNEMYGN